MSGLQIVPIWRPHLDYAGEPMRPGEFRDPPVDIHELFAEAIQRDSEDLGGHFRLLPFGLNRLRRFIGSRFDPGRVKRGDTTKALCLALIVFNIVYFGGQLVRAVVS